MKTYSEKLKDPRWQRKRLEIMERDGFACQICKSEHKTLHVHHKEYRKGAEPWDYPDDNFQTLCEECHASEHAPELPKESKKRLNPVVCTLIQIATHHPKFLYDIRSGIRGFHVPQAKGFELELILEILVFRKKDPASLVGISLFIEALAVEQIIPLCDFLNEKELDRICGLYRWHILEATRRHVLELLKEPGIEVSRMTELLGQCTRIHDEMMREKQAQGAMRLERGRL